MDQAAFRHCYKSVVSPLPETMNWKPYWGERQDAAIVHFHGPKPSHIRTLSQGYTEGVPDVIKELYAKAPAACYNAARLFYLHLEAYHAEQSG